MMPQIYSGVSDPMSRGYRSIIFALVGCLILGSQAPRAEGIPRRSPSPNQHVDDGTQSRDGKGKPLAVTIIESPEQANASKVRERESGKHDARDLDAQIRAADAAERQIVPAWLAAVLSGIGTGLILWSLCLTRKQLRMAERERETARSEAASLARDTASALAQATRTANEAARSAEAIIEATRISAEAQALNKRQIRAEIVVKDHKLVDWVAGQEPIIVTNFTNSGPTIAHNVTVRAAVEFFHIEPTEEEFAPPEEVEIGSRAPVGAGNDFSVQIKMPRIDAPSIELHRKGGIRVFVFGKITFKDINLDERWMTFRVELMRNCIFRLCERGNDGN